jgi:hypothetical protein
MTGGIGTGTAQIAIFSDFWASVSVSVPVPAISPSTAADIAPQQEERVRRKVQERGADPSRANAGAQAQREYKAIQCIYILLFPPHSPLQHQTVALQLPPACLRMQHTYDPQGLVLLA